MLLMNTINFVTKNEHDFVTKLVIFMHIAYAR